MKRSNLQKPAPKQNDEKSTRRPETLQHEGDRWLLTGPNTATVHRDTPGLVPALENAIAIIETINSLAPRQVTLAELSTALGISRSHCHSILKTLTACNWLRFDERLKVYQLDMGILPSISSIFRSGRLDTIRVTLDELVHRIKLPIVLSKPQPDFSYVLVDKFNVSHVMEVSHPIGHRYPPDVVGQSRAFLAWQPQSVIDAWLNSWKPVRYTKNTRVTKQEILDELRRTRERGYVRSDEEFADGLLAFCLPVFDDSASVSFIVSCISVKAVMTRNENEVVSEMIAAVAKIHYQTGARVPPDFPATLRA